MTIEIKIVIASLIGYLVGLLVNYLYITRSKVARFIEENDNLIETNYLLVLKTERQKDFIDIQAKTISDLAEEVQTYRNSFNNN